MFYYRDALMFHLQLMDERGTTGQIMARYRAPPQQCPDYSGRPLGTSQCLAAFVLLAVGVAAAVISLG